MARLADKRKKVEESSGDERLPARQPKTRRQSMSTVRFADTTQALSFSEHHRPMSILKTRSTPFPTAPGNPVREGAPSPEPLKQPEDKEVDTEESNVMKKLAALQAVKRAEKEQLKQHLASVQKELELTRNDLENVRFREKITMQARDRAVRALKDANERMEAGQAELEEVLSANGRLGSKLRIADQQVEKLERELAIVREEKSGMDESMREKTANDTAKTGSDVHHTAQLRPVLRTASKGCTGTPLERRSKLGIQHPPLSLAAVMRDVE